MSQPLIVSTSAAISKLIEEIDGLEWATFDRVTADQTAGRKILVLGTSIEDADTHAQMLISSGIGRSRVEFSAVETMSARGLCDAIAAPRHVFWRDVALLRDAPQEVAATVYPSGIGFLDKNLQWGWRLPELGIVAGAYGSGKSTFMQQLAFNFVAANGAALNTGALLCSWEDDPGEMRRNMTQFASGYEGYERATHQFGRWETEPGNPELLKDRIHYVRRPPEADRLVSWYMDVVEFHHDKFGTKFFTLDPWNELDHVKNVRQLETEYTRDMMKEFRRLVDKLKIILLIATHVSAKNIRGDGSIEPFRIAHSFGSSQFGNKADRGMCVCRAKKFNREGGGVMVMHLDKVKVERTMGKKGTVAARWNPERGRFDYDGAATAEFADVWKD